MIVDGFEFDRRGDFDIESAIFQALGAASMCWSKIPQGIFESDRARQIGYELLNEVMRQIQEQQMPLWDAAQAVHGKSHVLDSFITNYRKKALDSLGS